MPPLNIAITGHTSGLGNAMFEFFSNHGHQVNGYSRQTGFDLRDWNSLQKLLDLTDSCDLIISNAKPDFFQTVLLYEFARREKFNTKIISIGSGIIKVDIPTTLDVGINLYKTQKLALRDAHLQLTKRYANLQSLLIHPGHLYDSDGTTYTNISAWVERMNTIIANIPSGEVYVE